MASPREMGIVEDIVDAQLDEEIASLQARIQTLKSRRAIQASNIVTSRACQSILTRLQASSDPISSDAPNDANPLHAATLNFSRKQLAHNQACLYRTCAGVTMFKVQDPDPNAVDGGKLIGIRIEAFAGGKFLRPYYLFLNKPYRDLPNIFRVHRHTVPPCIPLAGLAERYMPTPAGDTLKAKKQNLLKFVKCLRREIASYHNRLASIAGLRRAFALDVKGGRGIAKEQDVRDISAIDAEAKQLRVEWADGRIARVLVGDKGEVLKCVVIGADGSDKSLARQVLGGDGRVESLAERL